MSKSRIDDLKRDLDQISHRRPQRKSAQEDVIGRNAESLTGNDTETIERSACPALLRMGPDRTMVRRYYMISMC
jgi:hypothetical protein